MKKLVFDKQEVVHILRSMKSKYFTPELARFLFDKGLLTIAERRCYKVPGVLFHHLHQAFVWDKTIEGHLFWQNTENTYYSTL